MGPSMTLPFISHIFYLNFSNFLLVFQEQSEDDWQSQAAHPTPDVTQKNILKEINQNVLRHTPGVIMYVTSF